MILTQAYIISLVKMAMVLNLLQTIQPMVNILLIAQLELAQLRRVLIVNYTLMILALAIVNIHYTLKVMHQL